MRKKAGYMFFVLAFSVVICWVYVKLENCKTIGSGDNSISICIPDDYLMDQRKYVSRNLGFEFLLPEYDYVLPISDEKIKSLYDLHEQNKKKVSVVISKQVVLFDKSSKLFDLYLSGNVLEERERYIIYGKNSLGYLHDYYHYYFKEKYPQVIGCVRRGRCVAVSSINSSVRYEVSFSEEMIADWPAIKSKVIKFIEEYKK